MGSCWRVTLTLLDDAIFTARPGTEGAHETLAYIPGTALWGWAANLLCEKLSPEEAWLAFFSGKLRFGCGYPLTPDGNPTWPIPFCLHMARSGREEDSLRALNFARTEPAPGVQYRQLRDGFLSEHGQWHQPARSLAMRTAIDPERGTAKEAQLFGYQALRAGQRFVAWIEADDDLPEALVQRVVALFDDALLHLGRSRAGEYGRVHARIEQESPPLPAQRAQRTKEVVVWLLSDLALLRNGQPCLHPAPEDFGLPRGRLLAERSFVRARRYAPFNQKRGGRDRERQVIAAGSVLTFALEEEVDPRRLPKAVGAFRECGLGWVLAEPALLAEKERKLQRVQQMPERKRAAAPDHPFARWLQRIARRNEARSEIEQQAQALLAQARRLYEALRALADAEKRGPSLSQWGRVREICMQEGLSDAERRERLFGSNGVAKERNNPDWTATILIDGRCTSFREWLIEACRSHSPQAIARFAQLLADELQRDKERAR